MNVLYFRKYDIEREADAYAETDLLRLLPNFVKLVRSIKGNLNLKLNIAEYVVSIYEAGRRPVVR